MFLYMCGDQRTTLWNWFSPYTCTKVPGFELGLPAICSNHFFLLSHAIDPTTR